MKTNFLGVMIDSHLQWNEHLNCANLKISKCHSIMNILRDMFSVNTMKQLYNSLNFQYVDHCLEEWGRIYQSNVNSV